MINAFSLENKRVLVTGASSGIGRVAAGAIAAAGASLIISGRDEQRLTETLQSLPGSGHQMVLADFLGEDPVGNICAAITAPVDGVVHSAGIAMLKPFKFTSADIVYRMLKINFEVPFMLTQRLFRNRLLANGSSVVFVSSIGAGLVGVPGNSMYGAAKAALNGALPSLAIELAPKKIRINSIMPGMVMTKMTDDAVNLSIEDFKRDELKYPLGYGTPEDIANTIIYFLCDASKWITGTKLIIDGGVSIS